MLFYFLTPNHHLCYGNEIITGQNLFHTHPKFRGTKFQPLCLGGFNCWKTGSWVLLKLSQVTLRIGASGGETVRHRSDGAQLLCIETYVSKLICKGTVVLCLLLLWNISRMTRYSQQDWTLRSCCCCSEIITEISTSCDWFISVWDD